MERHVGSWDLAITLDRSDPEPLYLQLVKAIEDGVRHGRFKPGDALPGTRAMADLLGVNRNTTLTAYRELEAEGWIEVAPDRGTFIAYERKVELAVLSWGSELKPPVLSPRSVANWTRLVPPHPPSHCTQSIRAMG